MCWILVEYEFEPGDQWQRLGTCKHVVLNGWIFQSLCVASEFIRGLSPCVRLRIQVCPAFVYEGAVCRELLWICIEVADNECWLWWCGFVFGVCDGK